MTVTHKSLITGQNNAAYQVSRTVWNTTDHGSVFEVINAKTDYGAVGDGSANDTAALQAAIDAAPSTGAGIYIPPGRYQTGVLNAKPNIHIFGAGMYATTLVPRGHADNTQGTIDILGIGQGPVQISNLCIGNLNLPTFPGIGVRVSARADIYIHDCLFSGMATGVTVKGTNLNTGDVMIEHCLIETAQTSGVYIEGAILCSIVDCFIWQCATNGIEVIYDGGANRPFGISIVGNQIVQNNQNGVRLAFADKSTIQGNIFDGSSLNHINTYDNIALVSSKKVMISGNVATHQLSPNQTRYGISIDAGCEDVRYMNNDMVQGAVSGEMSDAGTRTLKWVQSVLSIPTGGEIRMVGGTGIFVDDGISNAKITGDAGRVRIYGGPQEAMRFAQAATTTLNPFYPPDLASLNGQSAAALYEVTGVPSNLLGNNGDFALRSDGGAGSCIYQKRAGAWVATGA